MTKINYFFFYLVKSTYYHCCKLLQQASKKGIIKLNKQIETEWKITPQPKKSTEYNWNNSLSEKLVSELQQIPQILQ
ncbi:MAG: hypothetical protein F6K39_38030 [Okeania sp. SIO3B3]|nr:hypothetical protein [Okeania sp. SIO3B3]